MRALRNTKGVIATTNEHTFPAEHIHVDGNEVTVATFELCPTKKRKLTYLLVRKIARRYAKGEKVAKA